MASAQGDEGGTRSEASDEQSASTWRVYRFEPEPHPAIRNVWRMIGVPRERAFEGFEEGASASAPVRLRYPLRAIASYPGFGPTAIQDYFDHNPNNTNQLLDYQCFDRTYDRPDGYDHRGTDFYAFPFGWDMAVGREIEVIAAASGTVFNLGDGEYDLQCSYDDTPGSETLSRGHNFTVLRHDDGTYALYTHLMRNSNTHLEIGQRVEAGEVIGALGSSGITAYPHLHFELISPANQGIDPFAGQCTPNEGRWQHQWRYNDSYVTRIEIHSAPPTIPGYGWNNCGEVSANEYIIDRVEPGQTAYLGIGLRDLVPGVTGDLQVLMPDGSVFAQVPLPTLLQLDSGAEWWARAYIVSQPTPIPENAPTGVWTARVTYDDRVFERGFYVGYTPEQARLVAAILPSSRSIQSDGTVATVFATIVNPSDSVAHVCGIYPDQPVDGVLDFYATDAVTNTIIGQRNESVDIAANSSQSFLVAFAPSIGAQATQWTLDLRFVCRNSDRARLVPAVNSWQLGFGSEPTSDVVAIAVTQTGDGIARLDGVNGRSAFAVATVNVGSAEDLTVIPVPHGEADSLRLRVCETDQSTGVCLAPASDRLNRHFESDETVSFAIFAVGQGLEVPRSPATNRVSLNIINAAGETRGSTSVAVQTR